MIEKNASADGGDEETALMIVEVPLAFVEVPQRVFAGLDRKLGYFGQGRFVSFYYEPRGEEVVWDDGQSYGFGAGGWCAFADRIAPLAQRHGFDLGDIRLGGGDHSAPPHVLLVDRSSGRAWFAGRGGAKKFLRSAVGAADGNGPLPAVRPSMQ